MPDDRQHFAQPEISTRFEDRASARSGVTSISTLRMLAAQRDGRRAAERKWADPARDPHEDPAAPPLDEFDEASPYRFNRNDPHYNQLTERPRYLQGHVGWDGAYHGQLKRAKYRPGKRV